LIYGPFLRGQSLIDEDQFLEIERRLDESRAVKVHVDAPDSLLLLRLGERGDDLLKDAESLTSIAHEYRSVLSVRRETVPWIRWAVGDPLPVP